MFEGYYAERVVRDRAHERARDLALTGGSRTASPGEERAVLATDWRGWSWRRAGSVLGTVAVALAASAALPASIQGLAWGLREILELLGR
ncbi:MAG: hypothetical protein A3H39_13495 [candidate division NC10 bacterium RIFCSPLOWO2_02_FULL_66_22]|nr:MAG: hypothetical protein A3H39_13495 [candidate division NC10 bacterium RIFCSPLOWO2_02_FULL_66_22]